MKKILSLVSVFILMGITTACGPTSEQAIEYNDVIVDQQNAVFDAFVELLNSYDEYEPVAMDAAFGKTNEAIKIAKEAISALEPFDGDATFRDEALKLIDTYQIALTTEHTEIIRLLKLPDEEFGEPELKLIESLIEQSSEKIENGISLLTPIQEAFSVKYNFEISEDAEE